jgi:hypothetical protein
MLNTQMQKVKHMKKILYAAIVLLAPMHLRSMDNWGNNIKLLLKKAQSIEKIEAVQANGAEYRFVFEPTTPCMNENGESLLVKSTYTITSGGVSFFNPCNPELDILDNTRFSKELYAIAAQIYAEKKS